MRIESLRHLACYDSDNVKRLYTKSCVIVVNTCLLLLFLNFVCWVAIRITKTPAANYDPVVHYGADLVLQAYPGASRAQVLDMLHETYEKVVPGTVYEALTEFKEPPFRGTYVNIDSGGFRRGESQGPWPPDPANFNIFVFGGSTTFGYGVADWETIPSAMQICASSGSARPVFVYNFGRAGYFSTQELMLYYRLLTAGYVPNVAIFVDGLNEFLNVTVHVAGDLDSTSVLRSLVQELHREQSSEGLKRFIVHTSLGRFAGWVRRDRGGTPPGNTGTEPITGAMLARARDRWVMNKRLIEAHSALFHVQPVFVWQPIPAYLYDAVHYHFLKDQIEMPPAWSAPPVVGYPLMAESRAQLETDNNFLWLADIQNDRHENLYVDDVHYSARFNKEISALICGFLRQRAILPHVSR